MHCPAKDRCLFFFTPEGGGSPYTRMCHLTGMVWRKMALHKGTHMISLIEGWGSRPRSGTPAYKNQGRAPPPGFSPYLEAGKDLISYCLFTAEDHSCKGER